MYFSTFPSQEDVCSCSASGFVLPIIPLTVPRVKYDNGSALAGALATGSASTVTDFSASFDFLACSNSNKSKACCIVSLFASMTSGDAARSATGGSVICSPLGGVMFREGVCSRQIDGFTRVLYRALWCPNLAMNILRGRRKKSWKKVRT